MNNKAKFDRYAEMLRSWSGRMNLVAPSTLDNLETRHFADCAQLARVLPADVRVVDLGSGAGFPGVVLAILGWSVVCTESIGKKVLFLNAVKDELKLDNLTIYHGRIENYIPTLPHGNKTVFTARAFAPLVKILDYVGKTGCRFFLLKGREIQNEIDVAKRKYKFDYELLPSETGDGFIIIIKNCRKFHVK